MDAVGKDARAKAVVEPLQENKNAKVAEGTVTNANGNGSAAETVEVNRHLTSRQREILNYIYRVVQSRGVPPSIREICEAVGLSSSSTVHSHLRSLELKNYIRRNHSKQRSIELINWTGSPSCRVVDVPVRPSENAETEQNITLPVNLVGNARSFLYRVDSSRYTNEAIMPGDLLIINPAQPIKNGDMVLSASQESEESAQVLKYAEKSEHGDLLGRVVGVIRQIALG